MRNGLLEQDGNGHGGKSKETLEYYSITPNTWRQDGTSQGQLSAMYILLFGVCFFVIVRILL